MSREMVNRAKKVRVGNPVAKSILLYLADCWSTEYGCFPSQDTIAADLELSPISVGRHIKSLDDHGWIFRRLIKSGSRVIRTEYTLNLGIREMVSESNEISLIPSQKSADGISKMVLKEEHKKNTKDREKKKSTIISHRIPDPFPLTDEMRIWASTELPDLDLERAHPKFIEYWTNQTGKKAEKVNWLLTWKEGMKLQDKWQREDRKNATAKSNNKTGKRTDADVFEESADFYANYPGGGGE